MVAMISADTITMEGINSVTRSTGELDDDDGNSFVVKGMNSVTMCTEHRTRWR